MKSNGQARGHLDQVLRLTAPHPPRVLGNLYIADEFQCSGRGHASQHQL